MPVVSGIPLFRPPEVEDAQAVFELMERCEVSEYGEPDSDMGELLYDWQQIDLAQDAWLAFSTQGDLAGYAAVIPQGSRLQHVLFVTPTYRGEALGLELLARCEVRSLALAADRAEEIAVTIYVAHVNERDLNIVRRSGYSPEKYHFQMMMNLNRPLQEPLWPDGLTVRTAQPMLDIRMVYQLIQQAFARPGRPPQPFDEWEAYMLRPDIFQPDLWFLAFSGSRLVGACLCYAYPEMGWVRQLGVAVPWRRRGLGSAFLMHSFRIFKARGFLKVGLGVEAANPGAYAFYQEIGMEKARQYDEYTKTIKPFG